ncbi:MAG TPA: LPS export ABC transporter ATP-binding protein [Chitinispirillaceae bacterium]|nr:LPS export ABC transporter ATP-binding protein [Chitinispirillaceae bacterium]
MTDSSEINDNIAPDSETPETEDDIVTSETERTIPTEEIKPPADAAESASVTPTIPEIPQQQQKKREIRTNNLIKIYSKRSVVDGASINVHQGEIVGLLGPNGAGKTTTFYMIVGLIRPNKGSIFLDDKNISRKPMYKRARMGIGYLPQEPSIFRKLSVRDNIMSVLEFQRMSAKARKLRMKELLEELHVGHLEKSLGYQLSGGERRRVEIARTLAIKPDFILLDEPFAGVDPIAVEDIQSIVHELKNKGYGVLITDHNVRETLRITDRAYIMSAGKILISGTARELAESPEARRIYLGQNFKLD